MKGKKVVCSDLLKILADDTRLSIVGLLLKSPKYVNEINEALNVEQSLLSHHLRILRQAGLVTSRRDGKSVLYKMTPHVEGTPSGRAVNLGCCLLSFT